MFFKWKKRVLVLRLALCSKEKKEGGRQTAGGDGEVEVVCGFDEGFGTNNDYFEFITFRFKKGLLTSLITF